MAKPEVEAKHTTWNVASIKDLPQVASTPENLREAAISTENRAR